MKPSTKGRRKPYSEGGIQRVPCARCGRPSEFQWNCCANGNRWMGVCRKCDIALNAMVLRFFRFENRQQLLSKYKAKIGGADG